MLLVLLPLRQKLFSVKYDKEEIHDSCHKERIHLLNIFCKKYKKEKTLTFPLVLLDFFHKINAVNGGKTLFY